LFAFIVIHRTKYVITLFLVFKQPGQRMFLDKLAHLVIYVGGGPVRSLAQAFHRGREHLNYAVLWFAILQPLDVIAAESEASEVRKLGRCGEFPDGQIAWNLRKAIIVAGEFHLALGGRVDVDPYEEENFRRDSALG